jgi:hypothetical protein
MLACLLGASRLSAQPQAAPALTPAAIDHRIRLEWKHNNIIPAPPVDDAQFLRRLYLDVIGTIPPPEAVTAFLADKSPDKRAHALDTLLADPRYADHWTDYWDNILMGRQARGQVIDRTAFRQWLHTQFEQNKPWNRFVYDLITASGLNSVGGSYARAYGFGRGNAQDQALADNTWQVNGAVNWILKYAQAPADLSGSASKLFLGVQIQCAQCHDHKTEKWKQEDFRRLTACFMEARPVPLDQGKVMGIRRVDLRDVYRPFVGGKRLMAGRSEYLNSPPTALDGTDFSNSPNRRQALAAWMTAPQNPWFAQAIVNRMWSHFVGRGFVEPIDDFRPSNPGVLPDLLKGLADDFVANGYDLKQLIRTICATQVYQLSAAPAKGADADNALWARYRLKPMGPDELLNSLVTATDLQPILERIAGDNLEGLKFRMRQQFSFLFDVDEEFDQKDFEGTIPQALMLLNGNLVNRAATPIPGTAMADVLALPGGDADKIEALYLRTLSRKPTATEIKRWTAFVNAPRDIITTGTALPPRLLRGTLAQNKAMRRNGGYDPLARVGNRVLTAPTLTAKQQAYEDLFWALLNSSEFLFNH